MDKTREKGCGLGEVCVTVRGLKEADGDAAALIKSMQLATLLCCYCVVTVCTLL